MLRAIAIILLVLQGLAPFAALARSADSSTVIADSACCCGAGCTCAPDACPCGEAEDSQDNRSVPPQPITPGTAPRAEPIVPSTLPEPAGFDQFQNFTLPHPPFARDTALDAPPCEVRRAMVCKWIT